MLQNPSRLHCIRFISALGWRPNFYEVIGKLSVFIHPSRVCFAAHHGAENPQTCSAGGCVVLTWRSRVAGCRSCETGAPPATRCPPSSPGPHVREAQTAAAVPVGAGRTDGQRWGSFAVRYVTRLRRKQLGLLNLWTNPGHTTYTDSDKTGPHPMFMKNVLGEELSGYNTQRLYVRRR